MTTRYKEAIQLAAAGGLKVTIGVTASSSAVLPGFTRAVLLWATSNCWVEFMPTTASSGSGMYLSASQYATLVASASQQISVIQDATAGTLYIKPLIG
ncbi:MAG: hypothetical protein NUV51_03825 [Sulfuricaulis sp.]|nr:hypothetical protein [Sulfuricaulis sp.]